MALKELFGFGNRKVLLHNSCNIGKYDNPETSTNYEKILSELGIDFIKMEGPFTCGWLALELGYEKEFIKLARKNLKTLRDMKVGKIIVSCPECFKTLSQDYKEFMLDWDIEVVPTLNLILQKIRKRNLERDIGFDLTYHDSSYLGRYSGIYETPREILRLLGHNLIEMRYSGKNSIDSGTSGGLPETNPDLADEIAVSRLNQVLDVGTRSIVTVGMRDSEHLKRISHENNMKVTVYEISDLIAYALGMKKIEVTL